MPSVSPSLDREGLRASLETWQANPALISSQINRWDCRSSVLKYPYSAFKINGESGHGWAPAFSDPYSVSPPTSLELCTETLGCENGALCSDYEMEGDTDRNEISQRRPPDRKEAVFPPPLMTLRGAGRLQLRRMREEGRFLLIPFKPLILEAERYGGRLVLRFFPREDEGGKQGRTKMSAAAMLDCDLFSF
ncbi:Protein fantastic four 3 [Apostasia shenzhenica]|uniref:Protein fantastic four 3 n=1 Tax=Apostasia shenzhenica TaxID=1088818 RepID=A0A2I0AL07_9ASPA|nr:Protein fantastic four 3 [Apostasia shenzhenica]